jgi:small-conductance mechanosensitive channel
MQSLAHTFSSMSLFTKLACAALGLLLIHAAFQIMERTLLRHFHQLDARYRVRKFVVFAGYLAAIVFVAILFEDRLGHLTFALGIAGAGLVVSLQDLVASFAGWLAIAWSNLYVVGDRVQVGDTTGDVIDISFMRTTIVETGNWVRSDLYSGRVVRIPNSAALKGQVFNYSQGFRFVWDEIKVPVSAESDHLLAREMLLRIARETVADYIGQACNSWKGVTEDFRVQSLSLEPMVTLFVNNGIFEFTLRYIVDYTRRTIIQDRLFSRIVEEMQKFDGRIAWGSSSGSSGVRRPDKVARFEAASKGPFG